MKKSNVIKSICLWILWGVSLSGPILSVLSPWFWSCDLLSHFLIQQLGLLLFCVFVFFHLKHYRQGIICCLVLLIISLPVLTYIPLSQTNKKMNKDRKQSLTLLYANLGAENYAHDQIIQIVRKEDPLIFVVSELNSHWDQALNVCLEKYKHRKIVLREDKFGMAVYSKIPFKSAEVVYFGKEPKPFIRCILECNNEEFVLWAVHPYPPVKRTLWQARNEQIVFLRQKINSEKNIKRIVIGDLNVTPWTYWFKVIKGQDLKDSADKKGISPTWPSYWPAILRIPIDHVLLSPGIVVRDRRVLGFTGCDHFPLFVEIVL